MASVELIEQRVDRVEDDIREIKQDIREMRSDIKAIREDLAEMHLDLLAEIREIKGALSRIPTTMQLISMTLTTWAAGAGIVIVLLRLIEG